MARGHHGVPLVGPCTRTGRAKSRPGLYQEQQAQALERLRLRTARDQDALWHIIVSNNGDRQQVSTGRVTSVKQRPVAPHMPDVKRRLAAQREGEVFQLDGFEEDEAAFPSSEEEHSDVRSGARPDWCQHRSPGSECV
ncbi:hypothetical protein MTO96_000024 [Rhipicephalus appendiculatus]